MGGPAFTVPTALFGGSFDPVHEGHLHVARSVLAARPEIKQFVFIPAAHSPGKPPCAAPPESRLAWLRLAAAAEGFPVWDTELRRGGESFTVDTLEEAARLGAGKLFLVLGTDAYEGFPRWRSPGRIRELARPLVVSRPGHTFVPQQPGDLAIEIPPHPASSTEIRAQLAAGVEPLWLPNALRNQLAAHNPYARK